MSGKRNDARRDAWDYAKQRGAAQFFCPESLCDHGHSGPFSVANGKCMPCRAIEWERRKIRLTKPDNSPLLTCAKPEMKKLGGAGIEMLIIGLRKRGETVGEIADRIYGDNWFTGIPKIHAVLAKAPRRLRFRDMSASNGEDTLFVSRFSNWGNRS